MSSIPNVGDCFLMEFPLTPHLKEEYGKDSMIVEAVYLGTISDESVEAQRAEGSLKEMYYRLDLNEHHIVTFSNQRWVNDLINEELISIEPLI